MKKRTLAIIVMAFMLTGAVGCGSKDNTPAGQMMLPDINSFSSTEYEQYPCPFPPVTNAVFCYNGTEEAIEPDDPRLIRLLNALCYSYNNGDTWWRQGYVEGAQLHEYQRSSAPMLVVELQPGLQTEEDVMSDVFGLWIGTNSYLLFSYTSATHGLTQNDQLADWHFPYVNTLCSQYDEDSEECTQILDSMSDWGDDTWIDLLAYAGFYTR